MFERLEKLYDEGKITETHLSNAVAKGWITQTEMDEITAEEQ